MEALMSGPNAPKSSVEVGNNTVTIMALDAAANVLTEPGQEVLLRQNGKAEKPFAPTEIYAQNVEGVLYMSARIAMAISPLESQDGDPAAIAFLAEPQHSQEALHHYYPTLGLWYLESGIEDDRGDCFYGMSNFDTSLSDSLLHLSYAVYGNQVEVSMHNYLDPPLRGEHPDLSDATDGLPVETSDDTEKALAYFAARWLGVVNMLAMNGDYSSERELKEITLRPYRMEAHEIGALAVAATTAEFVGTTEDKEQPTFNKLGGMHAAKKQAERIVAAHKHPEIMEKWGVAVPKGILLYGPPGTGKTSLVSALAYELGADISIVKSSDIMDMWLGNSEKLLKAKFDEVKKADKPTVLFFDEFDSVISGAEDAHRARQAQAGIFKTEMDNLRRNNPNVIVAAATNYIDRIDPSLIRAERFDATIYVPQPNAEELQEIWAIKIADCMCAPAFSDSPDSFEMFGDDINIQALSQMCESGSLTGADVTSILRNARESRAFLEIQTGRSEPISQATLLMAIEEHVRQRTPPAA